MRDNISQHGAGPGRPRGSANKLNRALREMILRALDKVGGMSYLVRQAEANPAAFMALLAKTMPKDVHVQDVRGYICAPEQAASMELWAQTVRIDPDDVPSIN